VLAGVEGPAQRHVVAVIGQVVMAVDQPGQYGLAGNVNHFGVGREIALVARCDFCDSVAVDDDRGGIDRRCAGAVDQACVLQNFSLHVSDRHVRGTSGCRHSTVMLQEAAIEITLSPMARPVTTWLDDSDYTLQDIARGAGDHL
jgi:hypothetical protein